MDLTREQREVLRRLARRKVEPLCPRCGRREQDSRVKSGFCRPCDDDVERTRAAKRKWWNENRGKS